MDIHDGFIVGIFNYCDRWCETCAFTSHCRLFADAAKVEAACDPNMKAIVEAAPLPQEVRPAPAWMRELIDELNEAADEPAAHAPCPPRPTPRDHEVIRERARAYCGRVHEWLTVRDYLSIREPADPRAIVGWFHTLIPAKAHRALTGLVDETLEGRADADGSAKVALLALDRSRVAWTEMVRSGVAAREEVAPFLADLEALAEQLERACPRGRAFVRPAFDEPEAVMRMRLENGDA